MRNMGSSAQMTPKRKIKPMLKVSLDSFLMPFFKPLTTEMQATPVMTQMMRPLVVSAVSADVAVETVHRGGDRRDAESERRANAKGGARDGKRIDQITDETVDVFTEKREESGANRHRATVAVANDPERDCDQNIRNPTVDTPVEQSDEDGLLSALIIVHDGNLLRIVVVHAVIPHRFGDAEGVQTDADSAREQHGKPLVIAEGGLFVVPPELDVFVLREKQTDDEDEPHVLGEDVQPRPVDGDPRLPTLHLRRGVDAGRRGPDDEPPKHDRGDARAHPVHAKHLRWTNGRRESVSGRRLFNLESRRRDRSNDPRFARNARRARLPPRATPAWSPRNFNAPVFPRYRATPIGSLARTA